MGGCDCKCTGRLGGGRLGGESVGKGAIKCRLRGGSEDVGVLVPAHRRGLGVVVWLVVPAHGRLGGGSEGGGACT